MIKKISKRIVQLVVDTRLFTTRAGGVKKNKYVFYLMVKKEYGVSMLKIRTCTWKKMEM